LIGEACKNHASSAGHRPTGISSLAITTNCDGNVISQTNIRNGIEDHSGNFINRNKDCSGWNCGGFDFGSLFGNCGGFGCR
jgi:hypothetical protein